MMPKDNEDFLQAEKIRPYPIRVFFELNQKDAEAFSRYCQIMQLGSGSACKKAVLEMIKHVPRTNQ